MAGQYVFLYSTEGSQWYRGRAIVLHFAQRLPRLSKFALRPHSVHKRQMFVNGVVGLMIEHLYGKM